MGLKQQWLVLLFLNFYLWAVTAEADGIEKTLLSRPQISSPRETLLGFIDKTHRVASIIYGVEQRFHTEKGFFHTDADIAQGKQAETLLEQTINTLDLTAIPEAHRKHIGIERALMLAEILKRVPLPDKNAIPNTTTTEKGAKLQEWVIPSVEIVIMRNTKSKYHDEYLFSAETVQNIPVIFAQIRDQPSQIKDPIAVRNFYDYYTSTPGKLLPPKWYMYLPNWSKNHLYWDQTLWQWTGLTLTLVLMLRINIFLIFWHLQHSKGTAHTLRNMIAPLLVISNFLMGDYVIDQVLNITAEAFGLVSFLFKVLTFIAESWLTYIVINWLAEKIWQSQQLNQHSIDASFIRTLLRLIALMAAATVIYFGAQSLGIPIAPLLAGFGALGLAIGIGAQEYFKNVVGGLTLFLDRPVQLGEYCEFGTIAGVVEEIGLRSTRIRTPNNALVIVPNAYFSNANITNFSRIQSRILKMHLNLRYDTKREQLLLIMGQIRDYLTAHETVEKPVVRLDKLGDFSLQLLVSANILMCQQDDFFTYQEKFLLHIMEIIENSGTSLAYPSQTLYLKDDKINLLKNQIDE